MNPYSVFVRQIPFFLRIDPYGWRHCVRPRIAGPSTINYELLSTHVGPQKISLDPVNSHLRIVCSFGRYHQYCVNAQTDA